MQHFSKAGRDTLEMSSFERTWLFQKRVVYTKFAIYVFDHTLKNSYDTSL